MRRPTIAAAAALVAAIVSVATAVVPRLALRLALRLLLCLPTLLLLPTLLRATLLLATLLRATLPVATLPVATLLALALLLRAALVAAVVAVSTLGMPRTGVGPGWAVEFSFVAGLVGVAGVVWRLAIVPVSAVLSLGLWTGWVTVVLALATPAAASAPAAALAVAFRRCWFGGRGAAIVDRHFRTVVEVDIGTGVGRGAFRQRRVGVLLERFAGQRCMVGSLGIDGFAMRCRGTAGREAVAVALVVAALAAPAAPAAPTTWFAVAGLLPWLAVIRPALGCLFVRRSGVGWPLWIVRGGGGTFRVDEVRAGRPSPCWRRGTHRRRGLGNVPRLGLGAV